MENTDGGNTQPRKVIMKSVFALLALSLMFSCAHVSKTNKLRLGMDRAEFEKIMGEPETTKGHAGQTYLTYELMERRGFPVQHGNYVFIFNGENKLVQFGHARDFKDETNVNVFHNR